MALSFDQYRYFSAAFVRDHAQRVRDQAAASATPAPRPTSTPVRPTSITWLVPRPRVTWPKPD